jgi:hypothetical protein
MYADLILWQLILAVERDLALAQEGRRRVLTQPARQPRGRRWSRRQLTPASVEPVGGACRAVEASAAPAERATA